MNTILYLLLTLLLLSIMVVIHELGHFLFAKLFRVTVLEFSIGMGPAIFTTKKKDKKKRETNGGELDVAERFHYGDEPINTSVLTESEKSETQEQLPEDYGKTAFSIRALPIGGYVSMAGEDEASADKNAFCNKPVWKRFIITIAGAVMNILLGIICMFTLVGIESAERGYLVSTTIGGFMEGSTSNILTEENKNPLQVGDTIVKVEGVGVHTGNEIAYEIMHVGHKPVDLVVIRNGKEIVLEDVIFPRDEQSGS